MCGHADALPKFQVHTSGTLLHRSIGALFFLKRNLLEMLMCPDVSPTGFSWIADNRAQAHMSGQTGTHERVCSLVREDSVFQAHLAHVSSPRPRDMMVAFLPPLLPQPSAHYPFCRPFARPPLLLALVLA